ncbi:MAG TPA: hypothetical protein VG651_08210 [Stellaceae bacterium]|nr:hypothetical protein [Stellaceae bacterium]
MTYYLNARPMIRALYEAPEEFEIRRNCLRHRPTKHWLVFDDDGNARILARCDCMVLRVSREQSEELHEAAVTWEVSYWQPLLAHAAAERRVAEINREFAGHFRPRRRWRAVIDAVRSLLGLAPCRSAVPIDPSLPGPDELRPWPSAKRAEARHADLLSA